jgi:hypothetical protein
LSPILDESNKIGPRGPVVDSDTGPTASQRFYLAFIIYVTVSAIDDWERVKIRYADNIKKVDPLAILLKIV